MTAPEPASPPDGLKERFDRQVSSVSILSSIGLSLVVLGVIAALTIQPDTLQQIARMQWWMPFIAAFSVVIRVCFGTWRLQFIGQGRLRWMGAFRAQLAWDFLSNVTPSAIGGGPVAPAYISRDSKVPFGDATAIMLFAMLLDQIWFAFAIVVVLVGSTYIEIIPASLGTVGDVTFSAYFLLFLAWVVLFGYATFVRPTLLTKFIGRIFQLPLLNRFHKAVSATLSRLHKRALILRTQPPHFYVKGFLLTAVIWLSRYALVVIILYGFYTEVDQLLALLRTVAMMLGGLVMPTPGGAGGIEGLYVLMFKPLLPASLLAPTLLLWRILGYYIFIALGAYLAVHQVGRVLVKRTP